MPDMITTAEELEAARAKIARVEALADSLAWKRPEVCPCASPEACCGSEESCDAMQPIVMLASGEQIRAALAGPDGREGIQPAVIDAAHLKRQRVWSRETFGPGLRTAGVIDHITKELDEIRAEPTDVGEWVDVIILAFDGAWRVGCEPQQIIDAIKAKQERNEGRTWPDWRTASPDKAIEHVRDADPGCTDSKEE